MSAADPVAGRFEGRVAIVTGGARGIGRATAGCLAREGARVIVADLDAQADLADLPGAQYHPLDVTDEAQWRALAETVEARFGRLDILVNNAGLTLSGRVQDMTLDAWRRVMAVNVDAAFLGVKTFEPLLARSGAQTPAGSSIVNISSIMGLVALPDSSAYNSSKGAIRLFTKSIAIEFAEAGVPIRANSVHPGFVKTGMIARGVEELAAQLGDRSADDLLQGFALATPLKRLAEPIEIARAVAFLASDDSSYMTGSELVVDGGWTAR